MAGGRPSKYKKEYCDRLIAHVGGGLSFDSFAGEIGVSRDTIYEWCKKHEEFSDAKRVSEAKSLTFWEKVGRAGTLDQLDKITGKTGAKFNHIAWIFLMKNRFGWRDHVQVTDTSDVKKIEVSYKID